MNLATYKIEGITGQHIGDRKEQQDRTALFAAPNAPGYVLAVLADGLGGVKGGAMASDQILKTSESIFRDFTVGDDAKGTLAEIITEAHAILKISGLMTNQEPQTTVVALILTPNRRAFWAHVGDSRLYRFRNGKLLDRTRDHTYVECLIKAKVISEVDAKTHKKSNVLTNVVGSTKMPPIIEFGECGDLEHNDTFMLCSDGCWGYFLDSELGHYIAAYNTRDAARLVIEKARERANGFGDNCSLAILKLIGEEQISKKRLI